MAAPPEADCRAAWAHLALAWCVWLLAWLAPALFLGPHVTVPVPWLGAETAPAALAIGAAFFLVAIWPFWPAWARGAACERLFQVWLGRTLLEAAGLLAMAAPFVCVAWALANRPVPLEAVLATGGLLAAIGVGFRAVWVGVGPAWGRWVVAAALALVGWPVILEYAALETLGRGFPHHFGVSPLVGAARVAGGGMPEGGWLLASTLVAWPVLAAGLLAVGASELAWRRSRGKPLNPIP